MVRLLYSGSKIIINIDKKTSRALKFSYQKKKYCYINIKAPIHSFSKYRAIFHKLSLSEGNLSFCFWGLLAFDSNATSTLWFIFLVCLMSGILPLFATCFLAEKCDAGEFYGIYNTLCF